MIDYARSLNPAQLQAVTAPEGNTLVVAGAGTGKTRTIVYRLAWLVEQGVAPEAILLLTFTRKAAREMLARAEALIGQGLGSLPGGTFHGFAYGCLRYHRPQWLGERPFTLLDGPDITQAVKECREDLKLGKRDHSFPKTPAIVGLLSKARNKECTIPELLAREASHLLPHAEAIEAIGNAYRDFRRSHGLMDYDDLLFELEALLKENGSGAQSIRRRFRHILVDEYQDTNLVQARLVRLLAQEPGAGTVGPSVMAVGDEAQSIYAFRGADIQNILDFPKQFPPTRIIRLEQNYRSTQPILNVSNGVLAHAAQSFRKHLFTERQGGALPTLARPMSDLEEAAMVTAQIQDLLTQRRPHEIAVLFRAGYHSYALEAALRKAGISFRKYGGLRFEEAAHIKDVLAFARFFLNPADRMAFGRIACMHRGVGPKTQGRLHNLLMERHGGDIEKAFRRYPELWEDMRFLDGLGLYVNEPQEFFGRILERYRPRLERLYPEDWPSRVPGLEEILALARGYASLDLFMADLTLENPDAEEGGEDCITLSTVHSAKGLEWSAVLLLDAVEDRFPSRHALFRPDDYEEERRLFYVACTRAKNNLYIYAPRTLSGRGGTTLVRPSPFLQELDAALFGGGEGHSVAPINSGRTREGEEEDFRSGIFPLEMPQSTPAGSLATATHCRHRIFGRGKIVQRLGADRLQVEFPGFGIKTILSDYLVAED